MSTLAVLHILAVTLWGGVVTSETFIETYKARSADQRKMITDLHYRIDLFIESPLLFAVLITGMLLIGQSTWSTLLAIKVAAGLVVIGANAVCIVCVVRRYLAMHASTEEESLSEFAIQTKRIRSTALFIPLGLAVFALGWVIS